MDTQRVLKIGYYLRVKSPFPKSIFESNIALLSNKSSIYGQILVMLANYFIRYSKKFDRVYCLITYDPNLFFPNGTITGLQGLVNRSEVDIGLPPIVITDQELESTDCSYPFQLGSVSFFTPKPKYNPRIFGIFETFSKPLWVAILISIVALIIAHYLLLKWRYSFINFFLHVLAVGVRQSSILKVSSVAEKLLVYSWVVGAMFICLAFDSVFLGFLAFPPVAKISNLQELATAVSKGEYRVLADIHSGTTFQIMASKEENLNVIGKDIKRNSVDNDLFQAVYGNKIQNFAYVVQTEVIGIFAEKYFISEDRFLHFMGAMIVRKNFCCKKFLETFVHRFIASGIYFKFQEDLSFLNRLKSLIRVPPVDSTANRKLTLIDLAPAFIFLLIGYFISFLVFIRELCSNRKNKMRPIR